MPRRRLDMAYPVTDMGVWSHPVEVWRQIGAYLASPPEPDPYYVTSAGGWRAMCPLDRGENERSFHRNGSLK